MADDWYTSDLASLLVATKLPTWRFGDAKLESDDTVPSDDLVAFQLFEPGPAASPSGMSGTYNPKWETSRYDIGSYNEILKLQTARYLYPAMGKCTTTEASPNIHAISLRTGQTPNNQGRHLKRENATSDESERIDVLGMLLNNYHVECSEFAPVAHQSLSWLTSFVKSTSTDELDEAALTDEPYKWEHFTFPVFTYNSETIEATIRGWAFDVVNTVVWSSLDATGFYTLGKYIPQTYISVSVDIVPYGKNAQELIRTALEGYATDLDLTVKAARNATNDYIQWTHDKLYANKYNTSISKVPGTFESYRMTMAQLSTGSCAIEAKDDYDDDYYENP